MKRIVHMKTNQYEIEAKPRFEVLDGLRGVAAALKLYDIPARAWLARFAASRPRS